MRILFLTPRDTDKPGGRVKRHELENEIAKHIECIWAGKGWSRYEDEKTIGETVNRIYGAYPPDWVICTNDQQKLDPQRKYKVCKILSDLHGLYKYSIRHPLGYRDPLSYIDILNNAGYDLYLTRYKHLLNAGVPKDIFYKKLDGKVEWLPWSIDENYYRPQKKTIDVTFIGTVSKVYPLRKQIWEKLPGLCEKQGFTYFRSRRPSRIKFIRSLKEKIFNQEFIHGKKYAEILGRTRIFIFGPSIYKYPIQKYFEGMASKCLVMADEPAGGQELGFIDNETYVRINKLNWEERLVSYLTNNESETKRISEKGYKLVKDKHTHSTRAGELIKILEEL